MQPPTLRNGKPLPPKVVERRAEQAARNAAHAAKSPEALLARLEDLELRTEKLEKK